MIFKIAKVMGLQQLAETVWQKLCAIGRVKVNVTKSSVKS